MPRRRKRSSSGLNSKAIPETMPDWLRLWTLRILVSLGAHKNLIRHGSIQHERIALSLGLVSSLEEALSIDEDEVYTRLFDLYGKAEETSESIVFPQIPATNCDQVAQLLGLSELERDVLLFAVLLHSNPMLESVTELLGEPHESMIVNIIAGLLDVKTVEIRNALHPSNTLTNTGLVNIYSTMSRYFLKNKVDVLSNHFVLRMTTSETDPVLLFQDVFDRTTPADLTLQDYPHIALDIAHCCAHVEQSLSTRRTGVNILIHGLPGTGKSQFARVLAEHLDIPLFQIASQDENGEPIRGEKRLNAYKIAQSVLSHQPCLLVFDEIDDVFSDGGLGFYNQPSTGQKLKAWINRTLEENALPCIWISNHIDNMDPAFLRRFDMVLEMPIPPEKLRLGMIERICGDMIQPEQAMRLAKSDHLAPAVLKRATGVARSVHEREPDTDVCELIERFTEKTLIAQGHGRLPKKASSFLPSFYDPDYINADTDLHELLSGIADAGSARLCLFGAPGTGKTAFVHWLARELDRPLIQRHVSDLVSPFVGVTEQRIANSFQKALDEEAILLLDEVDSFLQDRSNAKYTWEVTQVNELLTQIESFQGVFIAATNFQERLDAAALRRFDAKIRFDYLRADQSVMLLQNALDAMDLSIDDMAASRVRRLSQLTPGDFSTVIRRGILSRPKSAVGFVQQLEEECAFKSDREKSRIGFM